jgi:putative Holliday junction resolvase
LSGTGRVLALDLGSRRIGVAVSDPLGVLASPLKVLQRGGEHAQDHEVIAALVAESGAERVVVGLPRSLDGSIGPAAQGVLDEVQVLAELLPVPVELHDERFTTVTAERVMIEQNEGVPERRSRVDSVAAAVMLQSWLDRAPRSKTDDETEATE